MDALLFERCTSAISGLLVQHRYVFISGRQITNMLAANVDEVIRFKNCWNHLVMDRHVTRDGMYRHHRYGQLMKYAEQEELISLPQQQISSVFNSSSSHGCNESGCTPLTETFIESLVLSKLLQMICGVLDMAEHKPTNWLIELHPQRIVAEGGNQGLATPEYICHDDANFYVSMVLNRNNISGGDLMVNNKNNELLEHLLLVDPFDTVLANARNTKYELYPIALLCRERCAYQDVLVITFTKMEI